MTTSHPPVPGHWGRTTLVLVVTSVMSWGCGDSSNSTNNGNEPCDVCGQTDAGIREGGGSTSDGGGTISDGGMVGVDDGKDPPPILDPSGLPSSYKRRRSC